MAKMIVEKVFKLSDDYVDIFINKTAEYTIPYTELRLSSRTIHKSFYENLYAIEPKAYYYIQLSQDSVVYDNIPILLKSGLLYQVDEQNHRIYIYNCGENVVYIEQGVDLMR